MLTRRTELKRTGIKTGTKSLTRKAPMKQSGSDLKRSRVNPVSANRKERKRELAAVVAEKRRTVRYCQAQPMLKAALSHPDNTQEDRDRYVAALQACNPLRPERPHHMLKRSRGNDATLTAEANIVLICPSCDDFTEAEVKLSTRAGLLIPSSVRSRILGRIVP